MRKLVGCLILVLLAGNLSAGGNGEIYVIRGSFMTNAPETGDQITAKVEILLRHDLMSDTVFQEFLPLIAEVEDFNIHTPDLKNPAIDEEGVVFFPPRSH
jgi:hypothetical protein